MYDNSKEFFGNQLDQASVFIQNQSTNKDFGIGVDCRSADSTQLGALPGVIEKCTTKRVRYIGLYFYDNKRLTKSLVSKYLKTLRRVKSLEALWLNFNNTSCSGVDTDLMNKFAAFFNGNSLRILGL